MGLAAAWEPGDRRISELVARYGAVEVWASLGRDGDSALARRAEAVRLDRLQRQMDLLELRFIVPGDPEWPAGVDDLARTEVGELGGSPLGLWLTGPASLADLARSSVAVVGSRAATAYGEHVTADLAVGLAERGQVVVSGGAYGIDAAAHRACLAVNQPTVAFMAGGLSQLYPAGNSRLLTAIRSEHVLVSEHPPDRTPSRLRFLSRNRLIAAVSQATVIVEAGVRSGAANTVRWAQSLGRPVLAVPGPVTSAVSWTPHRLIRDGEAILVTSAEEVAAVLGPLDPAQEAASPTRGHVLDRLGPKERTVFEELPARGETLADDIALRTGLTVVEVLTALSRLDGEALAQRTERGGWRAARLSAS
jgi:DNA processing protein